jgi:predicted porin
MKMTSRLALVAAAATLFGAYSANAADLGGGCCADLEERVAELEATTARKGNRVVSLQVYGLVSRGILVWDAQDDPLGGDTSDSDTSLIDEDGSLFGFRGSASLKPGWTAGYRMEFEVAGEQASAPALKQNNVWIESEQFGRVTLGQASVATDGIAHIVLANTWSNSGAFQNGLYGIVDGTYGNFDGGRGDLIRYDSPSVAGFILSASWSDDLNSGIVSNELEDYFDVTLRYSGEFNAFRVAAGVGYTDDHDGSEIIQGSASIMHVPTGLFASFAAGNKEFGDDIFGNEGEEADYWYVNAGIEKTWLPYGATTVYAEYGEYGDDGIETAAVPDFQNSSDTMWGAGITQRFDSAALDIYLQYRHVEEDDFDDELDTFLLGTSIAF